jgi:hypothetical protein
MANRRFEMYQHRQVIHRMRMGQTDRAIAKTKLMGRLKEKGDGVEIARFVFLNLSPQYHLPTCPGTLMKGPWGRPLVYWFILFGQD